MPAAEASSHQQAGMPPAKEGKEKKEKPKSKTAQQVRPALLRAAGRPVCAVALKSFGVFFFFSVILFVGV